MSEGGWRAFREASKAKTGVEEDGAQAQPVGEAGGPAPAKAIDPAEAPSAGADIEAWKSKDPKPEPAPETGSGEGALAAPIDAEATRAAVALLEGRRAKAKRLASGVLSHWYVLAILPVAAVASLLAVRAGLNPYALCLEWWDLLFGSVFFVACLTFLAFAIFRAPEGRWHPGIPALVVAVGVIPLWLGANAVFNEACREIPAAPVLLPALPPPIDVPTVPNMWPAPMPQPRPPGL